MYHTGKKMSRNAKNFPGIFGETGRIWQTVKKPRRVRPQAGRIKSQSFSVRACTWQKIQLRLQVWNLSAAGRQIVRAADCKPLSEKPEGVFPTD